MLTGFEDIELGLLLKRQRVLEENVFKSPPASWEQFNQQLGRWLELNHQITAIKTRLNDAESKEHGK